MAQLTHRPPAASLRDQGRPTAALRGGIVTTRKSEALIHAGGLALVLALATAPACSDDAAPPAADALAGADAGAAPAADAFTDAAADASRQPQCPGGIGCPCATPEDCDAPFCVETPAGWRCSASCALDACPAGWRREGTKVQSGDVQNYCVPDGGLVCRPCVADTDCQASGHSGARCVRYGDVGGFCGVKCAADGDCPAGHVCREAAPLGGGPTSTQCVAAPPAGAPAGTGGACACSGHARAEGLQTTCSTAGTRTGGYRRCLSWRACWTGASRPQGP
jgi:hypothetical protein